MALPVMDWDADELKRAEAIAKDLAAYKIPRCVGPQSTGVCLSPETAVPLLDGIRKTRRVHPANLVPIRHLYRLLHFDENHPFRWRLEHKLVQALVLRSFCPSCVPASSGLYTYLAKHPCPRTEQDLRRSLAGVYLKAALGSGADPDNEREANVAIAAILSSPAVPRVSSLVDEQWIVQERLSIAEEYRVHTIEDSVVPDLTYLRYSDRTIRGERQGPNEYVESVLRTLPAAFVAHSICGWDICRTADGVYKVIEVNLGGFHPDVKRGFQCSGVFNREIWGPYVIARLLLFVEKKYQANVSCQSARVEPAQLGYLYMWISRWLTLLRICELIGGLESSMNDGAHGVASGEMQAEYSPAQQFLADVLRRLRKATAGLE
jgi:hypothetical protein